MDYYLGPTGIPDKVRAVGGLMNFTDAGDMGAAADASRELWESPSIGSAANYAAAGAALALPMYSHRLGQGFNSLIDDAVRGYDPSVVRSIGGGAPTPEAPRTTPAQEVAGLLSAGRASEVTDDLMARADPQEMWRLYTDGATGADMPMDEASRLARAQGMGFDQDLYHGSFSDFDAFDANVGSRRFDNKASRAGVWSTTNPEEAYAYGTATYPISVRGRQATYGSLDDEAMEVLERLRRTAGREIVTYYETMPTPAAEAAQKFIDGFEWTDNPAFYTDVAAARANKARLAGYDSAMFVGGEPMTGVAEAGDNLVTFDPTNIRSRFARFDPRLAHLRNLSAGVGGLGLLGASMPPQTSVLGEPVTQEQQGLPFMSMIKGLLQ